MDVRFTRGWSTMLGGLLTLTVGAATLAPGATAAPVLHKCPNKLEVLEIEVGPGEAPNVVKVTYKAIATHGVTCAAADKFLGLEVKDRTSTPPEGYKCKNGGFKAPVGSVAETCTKGTSRIQFAGPGG
jgi:hypothetical protein